MLKRQEQEAMMASSERQDTLKYFRDKLKRDKKLKSKKLAKSVKLKTDKDTA